MKILLVEDEKNLSAAIEKALKLNMHEVDCAYDGIEALNSLKFFKYDIIVMDVMMPKLDGIGALKKMRANGDQTPVILLTAKSEIEDKMAGFNAGADDYITKPFYIKELLARINAVTRRKGDIVDLNKFGNILFNSNTCVLKNDDNQKEVHLTRKEYLLITYLLKHQGKLITSEAIFSNVWPNDTEAYITVVWVFISNIRKKLKELDANIEIKASRGIGYTLVLKDVQES